MSIDIKGWWDGTVLYTAENATDVKQALEEAVLSGAVLRGADLRDAVLSGAVLRDAVLSDADLSGAHLRGADLSGADLRGADLSGAHLRDADLSGAVLRGADLRDAHLSDAHLRDADLRGADLRGADLSGIRNDLWDVLDRAPAEVAGLRRALVDGKVNGSVYEGKCSCLVGTLAAVRGCGYTEIEGLAPDAARPAEGWFIPINPGDIPTDEQPVSEGVFRATVAVRWIDEWRESRVAIAKALTS